MDSAFVSTIPPGTYRVFVGFQIKKDGSIANACILSDPGYGLGEKVLTVIRRYKIKNYDPPVFEVHRRQPITFVIEEEGEDECLPDNTSNI